MREHTAEVTGGKRFEFGRNWASFLEVLNNERIAEAKMSLIQMLGMTTLERKKFLDIGSGSGLTSLAARSLGAHVYSFDYDPDSVWCSRELKRRYFPDDPSWQIEEGSALNNAFLSSLGQFDIVCSWGVLHHTGDMWRALDNIVPLVATGGTLFVAIYNDEGKKSIRWTKVKSLYNRLPRSLRFLIIVPWALLQLWRPVTKGILCGRPFECFNGYDKQRGMSYWHDFFDWLGGFPFEVARPEHIFDFYRTRGFQLIRLVTDPGPGCNQFVFVKGKE